MLYKNFQIVQLKDNLLVHYISVGQGDATAINFPDGTIMLIDTGPDDSASTLSTYLTNKVLNNKRDKTIDNLILTHADADHIGGAMRILNDFDVEQIFMPVIESDTNVYNNLVTYIEDNKINSSIITEWSDIFGLVNVKMYEPLDRNSTNNTCPLIKINYRNVSMLFTGDIDSSAETEFVELYGEELDVDILKIAHHGSLYSTSEAFLNVTTPDYAIISVGENNSYGHPSEVVLNRLSEMNVEIFRTDLNGNVLSVVGEDYGMKFLTTDYIITNLILDYRLFVLVLDAIILVEIILIVFKKNKKDKNDIKSLN